MSHPRFDEQHFTFRVIRQAMIEAEPAHWRRRAAAFRGIRSHPDPARRAQVEQIIRGCEHRATICDLTPDQEQFILDEIDRSAAVHRYMRHIDDAEDLEQLRDLWRAAHAEGRLDPDYPVYDLLAKHFDRTAARLRPRAAA